MLVFHAQTPQQPVAPQLTGTSLLQGRVIDGVTNRPVKGAVVTIDGAEIDRRPGAFTGVDGAFAFRELPGGTYTIGATAPGYLAGAYGMRRPGGSRLPLELANGERRTDLTITLWLQGSISGTVTGDNGRPIGDVLVRIARADTASVATAVLPGSMTSTDDQGAYEFTNLAPGSYVIGVVPLYSTQSVNAPAVGRATAQPFDVWNDLIASRDTDAQNEVAVLGVPVLPRSTDGRTRVYPATFAPTARSAGDAMKIALRPGEARRDVEIQLRSVPGVRVSGVVTSPLPLPPDVLLRLMASSGDSTWLTAMTTAASDGSFVFGRVPAGNYTLEALRRQAPLVSQSDPRGLYASMPIAIEEHDMTGVSVTLREGVTVSGRFVIDGDMPAADRTKIVAYLDPVADPDTVYPVAPGVPMRDVSDGFALTGVQPGRFLVGASGLPAGWTMKTAFSGGRNVSVAPLEVGGSDITDLELTITKRVTSVSGAVRDARGSLSDIASVVLIPADRSAWVAGTRGEHQLRAIRAVGRYTFDGLPAGDYLVAAVDDAQMADWPRASAIAALAARATRVTVLDGEQKTLDLVVR